VNPARLAVALPVRAFPGEIAVVAEGVATGGVVERLRVRDTDGRELRRPPQVDEQRAGHFSPDARPGLVIAECADVAVGVELPVRAEPRRAPSEAREPEAFQALRDRPQLADPERLPRHRDVLLAHRGDATR
jgi:hypothetical protein